LQVIDAHIRRRLRAIMIRQRKRPRFLFRHLRSRGVRDRDCRDGRSVVLTPNGRPATHANGGTISFVAPNRSVVAEFHRRALAAGGKDEGAVGPREFWPNAYAGFVRDLDGNKLAAYCLKAE
jgi:hypothetical protein